MLSLAIEKVTSFVKWLLLSSLLYLLILILTILKFMLFTIIAKIVSEYDQEIPQSQTADIPVAP